MAEKKQAPGLAQEAGPAGTEGKRKEPESLEGTLYCWAQALISAVVGVVFSF